MTPPPLIALLASLTLALAACGGGNDGPAAPQGDDPATTVAPVAERPIVGIGEQQSPMFKDKRFADLGVKHVRLVVPYDAARLRTERDLATLWLAEASRTGSEPFITFGHSRGNPQKLPSVKEYRAAVRAFRKLFPGVVVYAPWNEINHNSQPTFDAPRRAAQYYNVLKAECPTCTVLAGDVLDQRGMVRYLRTYQRHLEGEPAIWGLHNYSDTNRFRSTGLKDMLATVKGEIWLTETGGLVQFGKNFPRDEQRAARATTYAIKQARDNERVGRVYLYNWTGTDAKARFDAGLIAPDGTARPAYDALRAALDG